MRSVNVSARLTEADAIEICQRRLAGEAQHVLAAAYNVNPGRISEILSGKNFPSARLLVFGEKTSHKEPNKNTAEGELPFGLHARTMVGK